MGCDWLVVTWLAGSLACCVLRCVVLYAWYKSTLIYGTFCIDTGKGERRNERRVVGDQKVGKLKGRDEKGWKKWRDAKKERK